MCVCVFFAILMQCKNYLRLTLSIVRNCHSAKGLLDERRLYSGLVEMSTGGTTQELYDTAFGYRVVVYKRPAHALLLPPSPLQAMTCTLVQAFLFNLSS